MDTVRESKTVTLKTLTPVHIGSGRKLMANSEFIIRKMKSGDRRIGVIDEEKVLGIIGKDRINDWLKIIEKNGDLISLIKEVKPDAKLSDYSSRKITLYKIDQGSESFMKEQIFTGGSAYIPGSSIKGSIRTALFTHLLNKTNKTFNEKQLRKTASRTGEKGKFDDENLQKQLFGSNPNHDILRFLHLGDAVFTAFETIAMNVMNLNLRNQAELDPSKSVLTECIGSDIETKFQLKLALSQIENAKVELPEYRNLPKTYSELFTIINNHTSAIIEEEFEIWDPYLNDDVTIYLDQLSEILDIAKQCGENSCVLRLGQGSGWRFITGAWSEKEQLVEHVVFREGIVNAARPRNRDRYQKYMFPKTRRMDEDYNLLGFIKLSV